MLVPYLRTKTMCGFKLSMAPTELTAWVIREWCYLKGLGSVAILEGVSLGAGFEVLEAHGKPKFFSAACGSRGRNSQIPCCLHAAILHVIMIMD